MAGCRSTVTAVLLVTVLCATVSSHPPNRGQKTSSNWNALKTISHSNLDFTNDLYKILSRKEGNVFFSPLSIHVILALTSQGARGATSQQMVAGLRLPEDQQTTRDGFRQLLTSLHGNNSVTLKTANKIFTDTQISTSEQFKTIAQNDFHSASQALDFTHETEESRVTINSWVEENTANKIQDFLKPGMLSSSTEIVLVNAVYFKGAWENKFDRSQTTVKPFYVTDHIIKNIPMMHHHSLRGAFGYKNSEELNAQILEIPYVGGKTSLIIILPNERNGLHEVESRLARMKFSKVTSDFVRNPPVIVELTLPKFKLEMEEPLVLNDELKEMGMSHMFSNEADFSALTSNPTKIDKVIHKAFIEVNEEGTEAAAATGVMAMTGMVQIKTFNANHPFIFILANTETNAAQRTSKENTVLFMGRYSKP